MVSGVQDVVKVLSMVGSFLTHSCEHINSGTIDDRILVVVTMFESYAFHYL